MTTPRPQSFTAQFRDLARRVKTLEANRRVALPAPITSIHDAAGNVVVGPDGVTGVGLAEPVLSIPFTPAYDAVDSAHGWPGTNSTSFVDQLLAAHWIQHAWVSVWVTVVCDADVSAEVQLLDDVAVIAGPSAVGVGQTETVQLNGRMVNSYNTVTTLHVQAQRTAGTGSVWTQVTGAWGTQALA